MSGHDPPQPLAPATPSSGMQAPHSAEQQQLATPHTPAWGGVLRAPLSPATLREAMAADALQVLSGSQLRAALILPVDGTVGLWAQCCKCARLSLRRGIGSGLQMVWASHSGGALPPPGSSRAAALCACAGISRALHCWRWGGGGTEGHAAAAAAAEQCARCRRTYDGGAQVPS
jgi:hypothetical protein